MRRMSVTWKKAAFVKDQGEHIARRKENAPVTQVEKDECATCKEAAFVKGCIREGKGGDTQFICPFCVL